MMNYIPLRVYSNYSRGLGTVSARQCAAHSLVHHIPGMAVCDPHSILGWERFWQQSQENGLKPILGTELTLDDGGLVLLFPKNKRGFRTLLHALKVRQLNHCEDMMVVFLATGLSHNVVLNALKRMREKIPAENLFLGLQWTSNANIIQQVKYLSIPVVWAQALKYLDGAERFLVVQAVFNHLSILEGLHSPATPELTLSGPISGRAILHRWGSLGREAMLNTFKLAERVTFEYTANGYSPSYSTLSSQQKLIAKVQKSLGCHRQSAMEKERTLKELKVIQRLGFAPFFLIAARLAEHCHRHNIYFNVRGSAASSFILYLLGLSRVNPLIHRLIFERFVNRYRDHLPDIDIDIDSSRRPQVLEWLFHTFTGKVSFVSSHKFFGARSALYGVARSYGLDVGMAQQLSGELPLFASPVELLGRGKGTYKELFRHAAMLEGVFRELSLHVGGVVFSNATNGRVLPVVKSPSGFDQVVWDRETVRRLKIFKLDLLGVRGFEVIAPVASPGAVNFSDPVVWENIGRGNTLGCFQLESPLARASLQKLKPKTLFELAVSIAVIRPGPSRCNMGEIYQKGPATHGALLKRLFPHTRGAIIFEEQITLLLQKMSGWTREWAEKVRKDIKEGRGGLHKGHFLRRCHHRGWTVGEPHHLWRLAEKFSFYTFNQAHSISFAFSAYVSAWFKIRFPAEFFCRLLNSGSGYYSLPVYVEEVKRRGIYMLPPDINHSDIGFIVEDGAIRTGLIFIRGIGEKMSARIVSCRGPGYASLEEFISRVNPGEPELSALMAVSAFGSVNCPGFNRSRQKENFQHFLSFIPSL